MRHAGLAMLLLTGAALVALARPGATIHQSSVPTGTLAAKDGVRFAAAAARTAFASWAAEASRAAKAARAEGRELDDVAWQQQFPYQPYDGRFIFARIYYDVGGGRSMRGFGMREPPWHHDYPFAEQNFTKILQELTYARAYTDGGNILALDDPRLTQFPIAYMSEPGYWYPAPKEIEALRSYLLKGGFIIFDDFQTPHMSNLVEQMRRVMPSLEFLPLDDRDAIFDCFFKIDPNDIDLPLYGRGPTPDFWGLFEDNDKRKRMYAVAGNNGDLGEFWEYSGTGWFPVDLSNEAYKVGINYMVYAMTH